MGYRGILLLACCVAGTASAAAPSPAQVANAKRLSSADVASLAIPFVPNQGQVDARVAFYAPLFTGTVFVTREGEIIYSLPAHGAAKRDANDRPSEEGWSVTESLMTSSALKPKAGDAASARANYLIGRDPTHWQHGVPTYDSVSLGQPWPGIAVSLTAHADHVETFYDLAAGADVKRIRLKVSGAKALKINDGQLLAETGLGSMAFETPKAWQTIHGLRRDVPVHYVLHHGGYGFELGAHDRGVPVVIDPDFQATYLGIPGDGSGIVAGYAVGPAGDVYVLGNTWSLQQFPGTTGGAQPTDVLVDGCCEVMFVAKLNAALTSLEQATYLGAADGGEAPVGLALDAAGDVYVGGTTFNADFPDVAGGAQSTHTGQQAGFIAKLSPDLTTLDQSTYLGSSDGSLVTALAVGADGDVYAAGYTTSTTLPGTSAGAQPTNGGGFDGFVVGVNSGLTAFLGATYLGGSGDEAAYGLIVDAAGDVYVTGATDSSDFPGTTGGAPATLNLKGDAFIAKLNSTLTTIKQATYLGGSGADGGQNIALDADGDVYVTGSTTSSDFPHVSGGAQATYSGGEEFFIAKLNPGITTLEQATYFGGSGIVTGDVSIAPDGDVYLAGVTSSGDLPGTSGGVQPAFAGGDSDWYVARLNPGLTTLYQATYLGGSGSENLGTQVLVPAFDAAGDVYVAGSTLSEDFPETAGGAESTSTHAIVAKLPADLKAQTSLKLEFLSGLIAGNNVTSLLPGDFDDINVTVMDESADADASGIVYTVTLPPNLSLHYMLPEFGTCAAVGRVITCHATGLDLTPGFGFTNQIGVKAVGSGPATIDAEITHADQDLASDSVTSAQLDVTVADIAPTANGGSLSTKADSSVSGTLSATRAYAGQSLAFNLVAQPAHGSVSLDAGTGKFTYTPARGFAGADSFTFQVKDPAGTSSNVAAVSVTVSDISPKANGGLLKLKPHTSSYNGVLKATTAYGGQTLTYRLVGTPDGVTLNDPSTGAYTLSASPALSNKNSFSFQVVDQWGAVSNTATVTILVL
jgi:hypothetical protein